MPGLPSVQRHSVALFLCAVLLFVNLYSLSTLTTKPGYWYDEAINVELAHNFADFGRLDLVIAPNTFSGKGATVGSTGYPVTAPLAAFFKLFGFGLEQARIYMLLWMSASLVAFFFIAKKLWGSLVAYSGTALIATFAPFYGNGRSVMGEIPGFLFFTLSFYAFERRKWCLSGILLGVSVVSKPSVFIFLIPAYVLVLLCQSDVWRNKLIALLRLGFGSLLALLPWLIIYADDIARGGLAENIFNHFRNPYAEAGISSFQNILQNLPTLVTSTTLLYMWALLVVVVASLFLERTLFRTHQSLFILAAAYLPLALLQYLKSFGYLRYLIGLELLVFIIFCIALPSLVAYAARRAPALARWLEQAAVIVVLLLALVQTQHLFFFSNLYHSRKAQETVLYLETRYPAATVGVHNLPQVGSLIPAERKYQYFRTYGLWDFGTNILSLSSEQRPDVVVSESGAGDFTAEERELLQRYYTEDIGPVGGLTVYRKK